MTPKKSLKRIAAETGLVGLFGFAAGWAIMKAVFDTINPDDPNNNLYSAMIGIGSGTALGVASSGYTINWIQTK